MSETLTPSQLAEEGKTTYRQGHYFEAANLFKSAAEGYQAAGDALTAAEMLNNCSVALLQGGDAETALQALEGTEETFENAGDTRRLAMAFGNRGAVLEKMGRNDEAIQVYDRSAQLFKEIGETELRAPILKSLSALQLRSGRPLESLASFEAELEENQGKNSIQRFFRKILKIPSRHIFRS